MKNIFYLIFLFIFSSAAAQENRNDLLKIWQDTKRADTIRMKAIQDFCVLGYLYSKPDSAAYYANELYKMAVKSHLKRFQASALNIQGASYSLRGDNTRAIAYFIRSLKIMESMGDEIGISSCLNNIGVIYYEQDEYRKAEEYYIRALKLAEKMKDKESIALAYSNLGNVYRSLTDYDKSIAFHKKGIAMSESIHDDYRLGVTLHSLGVTYYDMGDNEKALDFINRSIPYYKTSGDFSGLAEVYNVIGNIYRKKGENAKAISYNKKALELSRETGMPAIIRESSLSLYNSYKTTGKYKDALDMYETYIAMRDSVKNEESQQELVKQELSYNFEKQKALDEKEHEKELAVAEEKEQKQQIIILSVAIGMFLVLVFAVFVIMRLQLTKRQKLVIEHQKELVEEKQKEILDSITYAKRLQDAILPPENFMKEHFPESFILYKPKDIVAGDFYWMEKLNDSILVAVGDCTGHGVPGAMVSVVCSNALNRAVLEFGISDPGKILDKTRELVLETFAKSHKDVKDGMDISLISVNLETLEIKWAGANNPLWYITGSEFKSITADKQPIGSSINPKPFATHDLKLEKGDQLFLFTDGYADQFGGERGKKFKYKPLKEMLFNNASLSITAQKEHLESIFIEWKNTTEQVDDVCILGVRL